MLSGVAAAQGVPVKTQTTTTTKPSVTVTTTTTTTAKPAAKTPAKPTARRAKKSATKAAPAKQAEKPKPSAAKDAKNTDKDGRVKTVAMGARRRDPFVNPMQLQEEKMKGTTACTTGARCLMIDQVVLKGVVKTQQGMIAMVENAARKQYNLREKDPVYNGFVLKITGDTIVFKESIVDTLGKTTSKEVVKRVTVPSV